MILCITHSQDFYTVDLFFAYLKAKNIPYFRLNTDELNHSVKINIYRNYFILTNNAELILDSRDVGAVWHRKSWQITPPEDLDAQFTSIFLNEYESLRQNIFALLHDVPWINPYKNEKLIDSAKILQLNLAEKYGLKIPETLFSNDETEIINFIQHECKGKAIAKLHGTLSRNMSGDHLLSTMMIDEENFENLSDVMYCPMIFQPYIEKAYELRITYIDTVFFTGKINSQNQTDWRKTNSGYFWEAYRLPDDIQFKITDMMQKRGLYFGMIDMIKSTDGHYYFLEINPQGEWGMLQNELGFPIAETIAESLIKRIR